MKLSLKNPFWLKIPPGIMIGAAIIMVPIIVFWTIQNIRQQKEQITSFLVEKGAALIHSFEAGTRTGMMGMMHPSFALQRLLMETAKQPDIVHLIVTDREGNILAHNNPSAIGRRYGQELDLQSVLGSDQMEWRRIPSPQGLHVFEVYSRFKPQQIPERRNWRHMLFARRMQMPAGPLSKDAVPEQIIFIGLDMGPIEAARRKDVRHTILMALILLLIGAGGIFTLFLVQAYQSTHTSLKRVQAFSDHLVAEMPIGLLATDAEQRIAACNASAEKILHISGRDIVGKPYREVLPALFTQWLHRPKPVSGPALMEAEYTIKTGEVIPLEAVISDLVEEEGRPAGRLVLFRDLSEIQNLKRELETTRRLAALGRLAAGVAHEIRNPLSSIKGFATFFKERYRENPEDQNTADIMIREVDRLNRAVTQLLEFARPAEIHKKPVNLGELVRHSLKTIGKEAQAKSIQIESNLAQVGEVAADADRMSQVLLNLYLNALSAMEKGGTLTVRLAFEKHSRRVQITVADTGLGIKEEDLEHIFDPYFTTRPSGTGLGLAIAHKIIEAHQGEIRVESEPGKGSTFMVLLPGMDEERKRE